MADLPSDKQLKIATIYSFGVNEPDDEDNGIILDENPEDTSRLDQSSRDFLESAIQDYNKIFKTNFDTSSDKFQNYNKDVSQRVKDPEIDLLIVVNMFLTGFDATTLNTLWVDKNLRKVKNILTTFDEFADNEMLSERDVQDYHSMYINLYNEFRKKNFIEHFIESLNPASNVDDDWHSFIYDKKLEELNRIISEENLDKDETYKFINNAFRDGYVQTTGTAITKVLPPVSRFTPTGDRTKKRESVIEKFVSYFNKFWDISGGRLLKG